MTRLVVIRANHHTITLKQLLQRLLTDAALAAIDRCKDDLTVECWAESLGVRADVAELQADVTRFRRENGLFTADAANEWLRERGMTLDDLVAMLRPQSLRRTLARLAVTEDEVGREFLECAAQFERAEISTLVVSEYGAAQEIRFRMEEGADFHALARRYSLDAATSKAGGYVGFVGRDDLEPEAAAAIFGAAPGEVVGPIERRGDYVLYLVEEAVSAALDAATEAAVRERLFLAKLEAYRSSLDIRVEMLLQGEGVDGASER